MMNIDYPFQFDGRGRTAETVDADHIRDLIEQFIFTAAGERVNRPDLGSGILQMVFAPNSPELASALQHTIKSGLQRWMGDLIDIKSLEVSRNESTIQVVIRYTILRTSESHEDTLVMGGLS